MERFQHVVQGQPLGSPSSVNKFLEQAPWRDVIGWLQQCSADDGADTLQKLEIAARTKIGHTYLKHDLPRVAGLALLRRGPEGVKSLANAIREADGSIVPTGGLDALWWGSTGGTSNLVLQSGEDVGPLLAPPSQEVKIAAERALEDLFAEAWVDPEMFSLITYFMWRSAYSPDSAERPVPDRMMSLLGQGVIRISPRLLMDFERLIEQEVREEDYQQFLTNNPVFLDPLAADVIPKQQLGVEHFTDFALRRYDGRYVLVEIEKPQDAIFNANNDFTSRFVHGFGQVLDFQTWVTTAGQYADKLMPGINEPQGLLVIGRAAKLSPLQVGKLDRFSRNSARITVITFDTVLAQARSLYANIRHNPIRRGPPPDESSSDVGPARSAG